MKNKIINYSFYIIFSIVFFQLRIFAEEAKWSKFKKLNLKKSYDQIAINPVNFDTVFISVQDTIFQMKLVKNDYFSVDTSVLTGYKINKLLINPHKTDEIFACTNRGILRKTKQISEWNHFSSIAGNVQLFNFENINHFYNILSDSIIFAYNDNDSLINKFSLNQINVNPVLINDFIVQRKTGEIILYIALKNGTIKSNSIKGKLNIDISFKDELKDRNVVDLIFDPFNPNALYAATYDSGVFWNNGQDWQWHEVNVGFNKMKPDMQCLILNPVSPNMLYCLTHSNDLWKFKLPYLQVALIDFSSNQLLQWEIEQFMNTLSDALSKRIEINRVRFNEFYLTDSKLWEPNEQVRELYFQEFGRKHHYNFFIWGKLSAARDNLNRLSIESQIFYTNPNRNHTDVSKTEGKRSQYEKLSKKLSSAIFAQIDKETMKSKSRKNLCLYSEFFIGGMVSGIVLKNYYDKLNRPDNPNQESFPNPPVFP